MTDVTTTMIPGPGAIADIRIPHREDEDYADRWAAHEAQGVEWCAAKERPTVRPGRSA